MNESAEPKKQFAINRVYVKDASFESPASPQSFTYKKWEPKVDLNLTNEHNRIDDDLYEVVLNITVTVSHQDTTAFLIEVQQAGLFNIGGFDDEQHKYLLGSQCMSILFPFAREVVSDLSVRGGFPALTLSPVSFDVLYQKHLQKKQAQQGEADATH